MQSVTLGKTSLGSQTGPATKSSKSPRIPWLRPWKKLCSALNSSQRAFLRQLKGLIDAAEKGFLSETTDQLKSQQEHPKTSLTAPNAGPKSRAGPPTALQRSTEPDNQSTPIHRPGNTPATRPPGSTGAWPHERLAEGSCYSSFSPETVKLTTVISLQNRGACPKSCQVL